MSIFEYTELGFDDPKMTSVWVAVADCGLNGSWPLAAWADRPTDEQVDDVVRLAGARGVTGYGGVEVVELEVRS